MDIGENGCFASNEYLAEFCQCSQTKVSTAISKLIKCGYISLASFDGRKRILKSRLSNFERQNIKKCDADFEKVKHSNIINNTVNNTVINNIIEYLNKKANTKYRATTKGTKSIIQARLNEGFTENDFKVVIDKKVKQWKGTEMEQYLRPQTLFSNKFESYLNQNIVNSKPEEIKPRRLREFEPELEIESTQMPEEMRNKLKIQRKLAKVL